MAKKLILAGATDQTIDLFIQDSTSTTGAGLTGLLFNTASLACYYRKGATGSATQLNLATQTVGGAHSDGGFVEISSANMPGMYRLDLSDTIVNTAGSATLMLKGAANMAPLTIELQMTGFDPSASITDGVWNALLTGATYNIATSAGRRIREINGGLVTSGTAQGGAAASITLAAGASSSDGTYDPGLVRIVSGTGSGQSRMIIDYVGSTRVASVNRDWRTPPDNTSTYEVVAAPNLISTNEGLATGGGANTITLNANASAINDTYVGQQVNLVTGTGQDQIRIITAYNGTTKVATVAEAWITQPVAGTGYIMNPQGRAFVVGYTTGQKPILGADNGSGLTSVATQTSVNTVDTVVDAIKLKTDQLTFTTPNIVDSNAISSGVSEAFIRGALGMGSANMDTQLGALPTNAELATALTLSWNTALTESYASNGAAFTPAQGLYAIHQWQQMFAIIDDEKIVYKLDGSTPAFTGTFDSAVSPTASTRT